MVIREGETQVCSHAFIPIRPKAIRQDPRGRNTPVVIPRSITRQDQLCPRLTPLVGNEERQARAAHASSRHRFRNKHEGSRRRFTESHQRHSVRFLHLDRGSTGPMGERFCVRSDGMVRRFHRRGWPCW